MTQSLFSQEIPETRFVSKLQWVFVSVGLLQIRQRYCACKKAPNRLSIIEPEKPAIPIIKKSSRLKGTGETPGRNPLMTKRKEPKRELAVPIRLMPPELPGDTFLKPLKEIGSAFDRIPISVPQVSALTVAKQAK